MYGKLGCIRKVTIPHRLSAEPPLHKGAFGSFVGGGVAGLFGGVKTFPYSTNGQGGVGAHSVRPCDLAAARDPCGRATLAPTATVHWLP